MASSDLPIQPSLVGRFVVELPGERRTGLAAHEVSLLLETPQGREAVIYRVHRVGEAGRMELVGVAPAAFQREDCRVFSHHDVRSARQEYDRIVAATSLSPPPCRMEVRLVRDAGADLSALVAVSYPSVCADAAAHWLGAVREGMARDENAGHGALKDVDLEGMQIVLHDTLEPSA